MLGKIGEKMSWCYRGQPWNNLDPFLRNNSLYKFDRKENHEFRLWYFKLNAHLPHHLRNCVRNGQVMFQLRLANRQSLLSPIPARCTEDNGTEQTKNVLFNRPKMFAYIDSPSSTLSNWLVRWLNQFTDLNWHYPAACLLGLSVDLISDKSSHLC